MTQLARVHNFFLSADGYGAGVGQSLETPFGTVSPPDGRELSLPADVGGWAFATASWVYSDGTGSRGLDDYIVRDFHRNIGAEIMGRNKFGPQRGPWTDLEWNGWWGEEPPFHTPVFVLTHHVRPSITLSDTTFHFIDASPADALQQAKEAADGKDVRVGGGVATVREFLDADLVDTMHVSVAPVVFGEGERLWESPDELLDRFHMESIPSPSGVTHLLFWRQ